MKKYDELLAEAADMGVRVVDRTIAGDVCGCWYRPKRLIIIDERMPEFKRRCTLVHELSHAMHDDPGCGPQYGKYERRARVDTACRCISHVEYASAEQTYEGDLYLIAQALDVPVEVVEDYRQWLHDNGL